MTISNIQWDFTLKLTRDQVIGLARIGDYFANIQSYLEQNCGKELVGLKWDEIRGIITQVQNLRNEDSAYIAALKKVMGTIEVEDASVHEGD